MFRALFFLLPLLLLTACYQPVYGGKSFSSAPTAQENRLNRVALGNIPDENGQQLRNLLIDRMYTAGRPDKPAHQLNVTLTSLEEKLGLQKDATTTRARLTLSTSYALVDTATGKTVFSNSARSVVSYNILDAQYATLASKENAYDRALRELSDMIVGRLLLYFGNEEPQKADAQPVRRNALEEDKPALVTRAPEPAPVLAPAPP
jgi:LPS-assembly lipoprotein